MDKGGSQLEQETWEEWIGVLVRRREELWQNFQWRGAGEGNGARGHLGKARRIAGLQLGVYMERRAAEVASRWILLLDAVELKLQLCRYVSDELHHCQLLRQRLLALGEDPDHQVRHPLPEWAALWALMEGFGTPVEFFAGNQFAHEAWAPRLTEQFLTRIVSVDPETVTLYRQKILPDEPHHIEFGRQALTQLASTPALRELAYRALEQGCQAFAQAVSIYNSRSEGSAV